MNLLGLCISGLQEVVMTQITTPARVTHTEDGLIVFAVKDGAESLYTKMPYFNNLHEVLCAVEDTKTLAEAVQRVLSDKKWARPVRKVGEGFRLVFSDENQLAGCDNTLLGQAISRIESVSGLRHTKGRPDAEFWLLRRASGKAFLTKRLTYSRKTEKDLEPGALRPELAQLLCLVAESTPQDIVLDPFAGSGALPFARAKRPYNMLFASDADASKVKAMKQTLNTTFKRLQRKGAPFIIRQSDALSLDKIEDGFVTRIITDPPWGLFDREIADLPAFYRAMMDEFCRVLAPDGQLVLLFGRRELLDDLLAYTENRLILANRYDILVSGKKASILRFLRC